MFGKKRKEVPELKYTADIVSFLDKIENIHHGGCGLAALLIAKAVRKDGFTPVFWCNEDISRPLKQGRIADCYFDHFVVEIKETGHLLEAGSMEAHENWARHKVDEAILRKAIRTRELWNRKFDRTSLQLVRHVLLFS